MCTDLFTRVVKSQEMVVIELHWSIDAIALRRFAVQNCADILKATSWSVTSTVCSAYQPSFINTFTQSYSVFTQSSLSFVFTSLLLSSDQELFLSNRSQYSLLIFLYQISTSLIHPFNVRKYIKNLFDLIWFLISHYFIFNNVHIDLINKKCLKTYHQV